MGNTIQLPRQWGFKPTSNTNCKQIPRRNRNTKLSSRPKNMSKQIKITDEFFKCCMPDLEQASKIFFYQEVKLVSLQRSKSIFSNKNSFSMPTQFSFTLFFQTKLACLTVSISSQHRIFLDLCNKKVLTVTKSMFGLYGLGGSLHGQ